MADKKAGDSKKGKVTGKKVVQKKVTIPASQKISIHVFLRVRPVKKMKKFSEMNADGVYYIRAFLVKAFATDVKTQKDWIESIDELVSKNFNGGKS